MEYHSIVSQNGSNGAQHNKCPMDTGKVVHVNHSLLNKLLRSSTMVFLSQHDMLHSKFQAVESIGTVPISKFFVKEGPPKAEVASCYPETAVGY